MAFYYNRFSGESRESQWVRHLQQESYVTTVEGAIAGVRRGQDSLEASSTEQVETLKQICGTIDSGLTALTDTLDSGFSAVGRGLNLLSMQTGALASMLDMRLSLVFEEQRITNQLLQHVAELLRIPDTQKQRIYHIERGLKYLKSAIAEGNNCDFYQDALDSFKEAERFENRDYIILGKIGLVHLCSARHFDFGLAKDYFLRSAREALVEARAAGTQASRVLAPAGLQPIASASDEFTASAAEAYLNAARACYLQQDLTDACDLAAKAFMIAPDWLQAGFYRCKCLAAGGADTEAVTALSSIIDRDRLFAVIASCDGDTIARPAIRALLQDRQQTASRRAHRGLDACRGIITDGSAATHIVAEIETLVERGDFLSSMQARDLLDAEYHLTYRKYSDAGAAVGIAKLAPTQSLLAFIGTERETLREALAVIRDVSATERYSALKDWADDDLGWCPEVSAALETCLQSAGSRAREILTECQRLLGTDSQAASIVTEAAKCLSAGDFRAVMKAHRLMTDTYNLQYREYRVGALGAIQARVQAPRQPLPEFLKAENESGAALLRAKISCTRWVAAGFALIGAWYGACAGGFLGVFASCDPRRNSWDGGVFLGTVILFGFLGAAIGLSVGLSKDPIIVPWK